MDKAPRIDSGVKQNVLTITIDNTAALNALSYSLIQDIGRILRKYEKDESVRAVIITGAGDKAFAAGADITELLPLDPSSATELTTKGNEVFHYIERYPKPIIAKILGYALGGGLELAMACHIRVASDDSKFGLPEANLGLIPGYGGTQRFPKLVGRSKAMYYILSAAIFDAAEAEKIGLLSMVCPREDIEHNIAQLLEKLLQLSPLAQRSAIECILAAEHENQKGFQLEHKCFSDLLISDHGKEGLQAFLEKRKPNFR